MGHNRSLGMGNASMMARMALSVVCRLCSSVRSSLGWDVKGHFNARQESDRLGWVLQ